MSARRSNLSSGLITLLALIVMAQSAALAWLILRSPDPQATLAHLRTRPVETVVELCRPVDG